MLFLFRAMLVLFLFSSLQADANDIFVEAGSRSTEPDGSLKHPFVTVSAAMRVARQGDTVNIAEGCYRESIVVPDGKLGAEILLKPNGDDKVVLSGMDRITGWQSISDSLYEAIVPEKVDAIYVNGQELPVAKYPAIGWLSVDQVHGNAIQCNDLNIPDVKLDGASLFIWRQYGNSTVRALVDAFDPQDSRIVVRSDADLHLKPGDRFWIENADAFLESSNGWTHRRTANQTVVRARFEQNPNNAGWDIEFPSRDTVVSLGSHTAIERMAVIGGKVSNVQIVGEEKCRIDHCLVAFGLYNGIWVRNASRIDVQGTAISDTEYGITYYNVEDSTIHGCDIGHNRVDGVRICFGSRDVVLAESFIHHHMQWSHPDGLQLFRGVNNVVVRDNRFLANGQSIMAGECNGLKVLHNEIVSADAMNVVLGHGKAHNTVVRKNVIAFSGSCLVRMTGHVLDLQWNVLVNGQPAPAFNADECSGLVETNNLFWNSLRCSTPAIVMASGVRFRDLDRYRTYSGYGEGSVFHDPEFKNAPIAFATGEASSLTGDGFVIRKNVDLFEIGDWIEINSDGVPRQITSIEEDRVVLKPGFEAFTPRMLLVMNWGGAFPKAPLELTPTASLPFRHEAGPRIRFPLESSSLHSRYGFTPTR